MAVIREDSHGLYLKAGGYYFRPIMPVGQKEHGQYYSELGLNDFKMNVKAKHIGGSSLCKLNFEKNNELHEEHWYAHGHYMGPEGSGVTGNSEEAYKPSHEIW